MQKKERNQKQSRAIDLPMRKGPDHYLVTSLDDFARTRRVPIGNETKRGLLQKDAKRIESIENTSELPSVLLNLVMGFVQREIQKKHDRRAKRDSGAFDYINPRLPYSRLRKIRFGTSSWTASGHARGSESWGQPRTDVFIQFSRRDPRSNWSYSGMKHDRAYETKTLLESVCFITAHELLHCSYLALPSRDRKGNIFRSSMEFKTQRLAGEILKAFRGKGERKVWDSYKKIRRSSIRSELKAATKREEVRAYRKSSECKRDRAAKNLAKWQAELRKAEKKVREWSTKVNRLEGARKSALTRAASRTR
jgi:hypothetical protein